MTDTLGCKLHSTMDAEVWAEEFTKMFLADKHGPDCQCGEDSRGYLDHDTMRAWFANALMCGWDIAHQRKITQLKSALSVAREALRHIAQDVGSHFGSTLESTDCLEADGFRQAVSTARAALTAIDAAMKGDGK